MNRAGFSASVRRTRAVSRKEILHIVRDPRSLIAALALPTPAPRAPELALAGPG